MSEILYPTKFVIEPICLQSDETSMDYMRNHGVEIHTFENWAAGIVR